MLTVCNHLEFYARAAGMPRRLLEPTITHILQVVGLIQCSQRMAETLSGGNKRKMSLAIAMVGIPKVLLLDELSTSLDVVGKRVMWKALGGVRYMSKDRNLAMLITSHSLEEVAALADRVRIMKQRMLAVGEQRELSRRYGNRFHVHVKLNDTFATTPEGHDLGTDLQVKHWIKDKIPGAVIEREMLYGQLRFVAGNK